MDVAAAVASNQRIKMALQVLVVLQLTAIHWPQQAKLSDGAHYDFIIVGGGSAGCVIANRLTEENFQVLLIEAGGDPPLESLIPGLRGFLFQTPYDWNFTAAYDKNREFYQKGLFFPLIQGKVLGGGSSINGLFYIRGNPHDFQTWADVTEDQAWNYENVLPYFKKSEYMEDQKILNSKYSEFHGTSGFLHVSTERHPKEKKYEEMFRELGYDILLDVNGYETLGFGSPSYTVAKGVRQSTAFSFIRPVKHRHNLHVLKNTQVTKILFDELKNAIGVQALTENNESINIMTNKEVIVTAGAINSAKLLLLSGIGPQGHLNIFGINTISDLPVGENLQDHPGAVVQYKFAKANKLPETPNPAEIGDPVLNGYITLNKSQKYPDCQAINHLLPNDSKGTIGSCLSYALDYDICQKLNDAGKGRETLLLNMNLLHQKSRGVIQLKSADPLDDPLIFMRYFSEDSDLETLAGCLEEFDRIRNSTFFRDVQGELVDLNLPKCEGLKLGSREYWKCHILSTRITMYHYGGACAMGKVVDSRLRVRGVQRLRVADSCAMPLVTSGNLNAPVIMLAEKAADMIKADNGCVVEIQH